MRFWRRRHWPRVEDDSQKQAFLQELRDLPEFDRYMLREEYTFAAARMRDRQRRVAQELRWIQEEWFSS